MTTVLTICDNSGSGATTTQVNEQSYKDSVATSLSNIKNYRSTPASDVVDISSYQSYLNQADFTNMKNSGVKAVMVKLTEGTSYTNPAARAQIQAASAAGLAVGAYHYSHYTSVGGAQAEANYFAQAAKSMGLSSNSFMVNDLEDSSTKVGGVTASSAAFNQQLHNDGFTNTGLYTGPSYLSSTGLDTSFVPNDHVWIAMYPYSPSSSNLRYSQYGMWQWTDGATAPNGTGYNIDASILYNPAIFNGSGVNTTGGGTNTSSGTSTSTSAVDKFKNEGGKYVLQGTFRVDDVQQVNGVWQIRSDDLAAEPFDWTDNGIPTQVLDNVTQNGARDFEKGDLVKFKSNYQSGYISSYDSAANAVGINYGGNFGTVWYDADKFWNHS